MRKSTRVAEPAGSPILRRNWCQRHGSAPTARRLRRRATRRLRCRAELVVAEPVDPVAASEKLVESNICRVRQREACKRPKPTSTSPTRSGKRRITRKPPRTISRRSRVYRAVDGPFTPLAIGPLTSLGDNYHEADDDCERHRVLYRGAHRKPPRLRPAQPGPDRAARPHVALAARLSISSPRPRHSRSKRCASCSAANPPDSDAVLDAIYKYAEWLGDRLLFQLAARPIRSRAAHDSQRPRRARRQASSTAARDRQHVSRGAQSGEHGHFGARGCVDAAARAAAARSRRDGHGAARHRRLGRGVRQDRLLGHRVSARVAAARLGSRTATRFAASGSRARTTCCTSRSAREA